MIFDRLSFVLFDAAKFRIKFLPYVKPMFTVANHRFCNYVLTPQISALYFSNM